MMLSLSTGWVRNLLHSLAIIVPELLPVPPVQGGAVEHWVDEVSRQLIDIRCRLAVVSRPAGVPGRDGVEYFSIPWTRTERFFFHIKEKVTWKNPLRYLAKAQNVFSYGRRVAKAVRNFDIIYLHNEPNLLLFLNKRHGQRIILHMHNDHLSSRLFRPLYRRALGKADQILCVSDYIRRQAISHFPEHADRFRVIFNATDPSIFRPYGDEAVQQLQSVMQIEPDRRYLLYAGRLTPIKGVHVLIEAFREIHRRIPDTRLIIAGSSFFAGAAKTPYEKQLVTLAKPVGDAIIFTGYLHHEQLKYLYSLSDIVVSPAIWQEPCSLVMLETMASGTCLVSSAVGGAPEIVENWKNGVLVAPGNPDELVEAVCDVLENQEKMHAMGEAARNKIVAGYTWERLVRELKEVLDVRQ